MEIKICGMAREEDIAAANQAKPDYVGFIFAEKSRRYVTPGQAAAWKRALAPGILAVGVFVDAPIELPLGLAAKGVIDLIQLHGSEDAAYIERVKREGGLPVIRAVSMTRPGHEDQLRAWEASGADYLLLDSGSGGTGQQFDYNALRNMGSIRKPFFLAGGLTPENLGAAVASLNRMHLYPAAVDLSSGVETDGRKDLAKMEAAVSSCHKIHGKCQTNKQSNKQSNKQTINQSIN